MIFIAQAAAGISWKRLGPERGRMKMLAQTISAFATGQLVSVLQALKTARVDDEVIARASGFLSQTQLAKLTEYQQRQTAGPTVESRQNAIRLNIPAAPSSPGGK
jgi:hypothetical protein